MNKYKKQTDGNINLNHKELNFWEIFVIKATFILYLPKICSSIMVDKSSERFGEYKFNEVCKKLI